MLGAGRRAESARKIPGDVLGLLVETAKEGISLLVGRFRPRLDGAGHRVPARNVVDRGLAERDDEIQFVDSRPSDAIALAVRAEVPIYTEESVLEQAGIVPSPAVKIQSVEGDEELNVFRDFVDTLDLDDLGE